MKPLQPFLEELQARGIYVPVLGICTRWGVLLDEIYQGHRFTSVVLARHEVWAYLSDQMQWSSVQIGSLFKVHYTGVGDALREHAKTLKAPREDVTARRCPCGKPSRSTYATCSPRCSDRKRQRDCRSRRSAETTALPNAKTLKAPTNWFEVVVNGETWARFRDAHEASEYAADVELRHGHPTKITLEKP